MRASPTRTRAARAFATARRPMDRRRAVASRIPVLAEHRVDPPPRVVQDLARLGDLILGARPADLDDRGSQLERGVAQVRSWTVTLAGDLFPRRTLERVGRGAAGVGQREAPLALGLLSGHEALVLQHLQGRVDGARARAPDAVRARLELLDHLVAVHRSLGKQREDRGTDVAAPHPRATAAAAERRAPWPKAAPGPTLPAAARRAAPIAVEMPTKHPITAFRS